jgi:hypothetical protein
MIKIYHKNQINDRDLRIEFDFARGEKLVELVKANLKEYTEVADVDTNDLDEAYRLTNSIDTVWYKDNEDVFPTRIAEQGCRSTSIGDIMYAHGKWFVVDSYGFTEF